MVRFSKLLDYHPLAHYNLCRMLEWTMQLEGVSPIVHYGGPRVVT